MLTRNALKPTLLGLAALLCCTFCLLAGCPLGTSISGSSDDNSGTTTGGATDTSGPSGSTDDGSDTATPSGPPAGLGGLIVTTVTDAANTEFDIYELPGERSLRSYQSANTLIPLAPGSYCLTQYFNAGFEYAAEVTITLGATTEVELGAIELTTVADASDGYFDIYDETGATEFSSYNAPNVPITAPAGTFVLREYFNGNFDYATAVTVEAGATTLVPMGGIKLVTVPGSVEGDYAIYDSTGETVYATYNEPDIIITAPPGTFTLKEYFNDLFTYASDVEVVAGAVTTVEMGAIRYNGALAYDIYLGGTLVSSFNEAGDIVTAPLGTYTLMKYFDDETVLATNVVVTAGNITEVN